MTNKKYLTVVFEYEEGAELPKEITKAFKSESAVFRDTKITAVSLEDEISRAERLEAHLGDTSWADDLSYPENTQG